ncbi:transthyretin family protein [Oceanimonas sp. GK1]|uniref:hydroxyisourate hydrolase n=1 Tax=Oceanimonas sp. (strain GK1 / IBRC-M 10197) TaxID=511062 RepID=UPI0002494F2F|nr:hydroxyisourate hydrolase [Oceanimonas sp. GK1]AEY00752.1 transthyretin family protein [Oceanimonas sp. GK1]
MTFKHVLAGAMMAGVSTLTFAAGNPLSVHVLNLENGLPSPDVKVVLEQQQGDDWVELNSAVTNEQGRITALYPEGKALEQGTYKVTFETGDWFEKHDTETFFPEIPVIFSADGKLDHYHVPLLLSPYGFSTYRGN